MSRTRDLRIADYLQHITEAIENIQEYTNGMNVEAFTADRKTRDAVIRNLEIIGEACNNISKRYPDFSTEHSHVPWSFAYEMRNALAHGYFAVDYTVVWQTIQSDLPQLKTQIQSITSTPPAAPCFEA
jgi:uncharacterized protein with HEPN domain